MTTPLWSVRSGGRQGGACPAAAEEDRVRDPLCHDQRQERVAGSRRDDPQPSRRRLGLPDADPAGEPAAGTAARGDDGAGRKRGIAGRNHLLPRQYLGARQNPQLAQLLLLSQLPLLLRIQCGHILCGDH